MKQQKLTVKSNIKLNNSTYEMVLVGENLSMKAGQFVELKVDGFTLRRPISVCACTQDTLTLVYKVVGCGTRQMAKDIVGKSYDVLTYLGNGFDASDSVRPLLIGGGIGVAPLYQLAKDFYKKGIKPVAVLGFRDKGEIFYKDKFSEYCEVIIATDDGSYGFFGNVIQAITQNNIEFDKYFACGPMVMMKHLKDFSTAGELSLEARMACGFGACMGCSIITTNGYKRVCKEGPIFGAEQVCFE